MLRHGLHALALELRRHAFTPALAQLPPLHRLRRRLRHGRTQRAFCAWAFIVGVLRWRNLRVRLRVVAAWTALRRERSARLATAAAHRTATLCRRAFSAWRADYLRVRLCPVPLCCTLGVGLQQKSNRNGSCGGLRRAAAPRDWYKLKASPI